MIAAKARLVVVDWLDSFGCSTTWQKIDGVDPEPLRCRSVGWLVYDGKETKVIVPHMSDVNHPTAPAQGCGDMTIPARSVLHISELREVKTNRK